MRRLANAALIAAFLGGSIIAPAGAADTGDQIKDSAVKAGTAVKDGAVKVGQTVKEGAIKAGETVKKGAVDLWEAGKSAVSAGGDTFSKRQAAHDKGKDPDAAR